MFRFKGSWLSILNFILNREKEKKNILHPPDLKVNFRIMNMFSSKFIFFLVYLFRFKYINSNVSLANKEQA